MNLIPLQTDMIKQCINQSRLLYLQPDMNRKITIFSESLIEVKSASEKCRIDCDIAEPWEFEGLDEIDGI